MDKIRVSICDDASYVVDCIKMKLDNDEIEVTGVSYSASDCLEMLKNTEADILLMDIQMENETAGIDIISDIKSAFPDLKIIMLTGFDDENYIFRAFSCGADNYILKSFESDICETIKDTFHNNFSLKPDIAKKLVAMTRKVSDQQNSVLHLVTLLSALSPAEYEVLTSIYKGATYKEIAKQRFVEECTIKTHAQRILKKTNTNSMKDLIKSLKETGLFELIDKN